MPNPLHSIPDVHVGGSRRGTQAIQGSASSEDKFSSPEVASRRSFCKALLGVKEEREQLEAGDGEVLVIFAPGL